MKLIFEQKSVYGKTLYYPINQLAIATVKAGNSKRKTLEFSDLQKLSDSGFDIEISAPIPQLDQFKKREG